MRKYKKLTIPMMFACSLASFFVGMAFITPTVTETKPLFAEAAVEIPEEYWIDEGNEPEDYAYSFMVIGDTQYLTPYGLLGNVYDYVVDNVASKKVKHVFGVGDIITGWNNPSLPVSDEWTEAKAQITRMDGLVTYSLVRGNHDDPEGFVETFGTDSSYANQYTWCYDNNTLNTIHTFTAGSYNYMVVALNFGPSDEVLEWAGEIIEAHPYHNVIITTHGYSAPDNTTLDKGDNPDAPSYYPEQDTHNNGDDMWNKLVRKYENISMVLSGHIGLTDIIYRQDKGDHGNVVTQMCINPQRLDGNIDGQTGMVATFYVNEDGETVSVEYYSTIREKFFGTQNQFDFTMSSVESKPEFYVDKNVEAFVRAGEVAGEDPNGMRFAFTMSEAQFASLLPQGTTAQTATSFADGVEVGAYLAPASEIRSTAVRVNTEVADLVACATAAKEVLSFKNWKKTENGYTAYVNLYNLPAFGYTEEIFACAYYTVNGQTVYTDLGASSLAKAAQKAIDGGSTETAFTEYLPTKLDAQLYSLDDGTIDVSKVDGEVLAVKYVSGVDIAFTQKGNVVTISGTETLNDSAASGWKLANEALGEITEVKVYTATNTYIIPLKVYSDVIDTAKEFDEMQKFLVNSGVQYNGQECKIIHGYFILADDLDFAEEYPNGYASPFATNAACADNTGGWSHGWNAVFDGNGHTIRGLHLIKNNGNYRNSLFGVIVGRPKELTLRGGVVKNVAFVDCSMANLYGSAFLANRCFGTVENVYLDVTLSTTHDSLDSNAALVGFNRTDGQYNAFGTFNNVTVVVDGLGAKDYVMKGNPDYNSFGCVKGPFVVIGASESQIMNGYSTIAEVTEANSNIKAYTSIIKALADTSLTSCGDVSFALEAGVYKVLWKGTVVYEEEKTVELSEILYSIDDATIDFEELGITVDNNTKITRAGSNVAFTLDGQVATISGDGILNATAQSATGAVTNILVSTSAGRYSIPVKVCSDVLYTAKDFDNMTEFLVDKTIKGYYILGADLDFSKEYANGYASPFGYDAIGATGVWVGWAATFEGNGHTISNLKVVRISGSRWRNSLFGIITQGGAVQNVAFKNCALSGDVADSAFLATHVLGTIENVYLDVKMATTPDEETRSNSAFVGGANDNNTGIYKYAYTSISNVTIVVSGTFRENEYVMRGKQDGNYTISNIKGSVVVIGADESKIYRGYADLEAIQTANSNIKAYESVSDAAEDTNLTECGDVTFANANGAFFVYWQDRDEAIYSSPISLDLNEVLYSLDARDNVIDFGALGVAVDSNTKITRNGVNVAFTLDGQKAKITGDDVLNGDVHRGTGAVINLVINNGIAEYELPVKVCSDVIYTAKEFDELYDLYLDTETLNSNKDNPSYCKYIKGYYILGDNLDFAKEYPNGYGSSLGINNVGEGITNGYAHGWSATFDGNGHTISGLKLIRKNGGYGNSLFGHITGQNTFGGISSQGVVKNVAFVNCSIGVGNLYGSAFLSNRMFGTLENVYLDVDMATTHTNANSNAIVSGANSNDGLNGTTGTIINVTVVADIKVDGDNGAKDYVMKGNSLGSVKGPMIIIGAGDTQVMNGYTTLASVMEANDYIKAYANAAKASENTSLTACGDVSFKTENGAYKIFWKGQEVYSASLTA